MRKIQPSFIEILTEAVSLAVSDGERNVAHSLRQHPKKGIVGKHLMMHDRYIDKAYVELSKRANYINQLITA